MLDGLASSADNTGEAIESMANRIEGSYEAIAGAAQAAADAYRGMGEAASAAAGSYQDMAYTASDAKTIAEEASGAAAEAARSLAALPGNLIVSALGRVKITIPQVNYTDYGTVNNKTGKYTNPWQVKSGSDYYMDSGGYTGT